MSRFMGSARRSVASSPHGVRNGCRAVFVVVVRLFAPRARAVRIRSVVCVVRGRFFSRPHRKVAFEGLSSLD